MNKHFLFRKNMPQKQGTAPRRWERLIIQTDPAKVQLWAQGRGIFALFPKVDIDIYYDVYKVFGTYPMKPKLTHVNIIGVYKSYIEIKNENCNIYCVLYQDTRI
jgi:hypothetical protein